MNSFFLLQQHIILSPNFHCNINLLRNVRQICKFLNELYFCTFSTCFLPLISTVPPSDSDLCFLGQYYEWQMKRGKFDGNKSGFILIYAAFCRISCPRWTTAIVRWRHVARHHHSPEDKKTRALHFTKLHFASLRYIAM